MSAEIKSLITDDMYNSFLNLDAQQQRAFLNELDPNELLNIELRIKNKFNLPEDEFNAAVIESGIGTTPGGLDLTGISDATLLSKSVRDVFGSLRDDRFDYTGLQNLTLRTGLSFMDTPEEKRNYLNKKIGQGGWTQDKYGNFAIMPAYREKLGAESGVKPLIIDNPDRIFEPGDFADLLGAAPEVGSAIATAIATRNLGTLPALLAQFTTVGGTKILEESVETLAGLQSQNASEIALDAAYEGGIAATGELGGRLLGGLARTVVSPGEKRIPTGEKGLFNFKTYTYAPRVDAASGPDARATQTLVRELLDEGAIPDVYKATNRSILGRTANMIETIFGYNQEKNVVNVRYMQNKINNFLEEVDADPFDPFMDNVFPKLGEEELGALILNQINKTASTAEKTLKSASDALNSAAKIRLDALESTAGTVPDDVGTKLIDDIQVAKSTFDDAARAVYDEADQLLGTSPVVPTSSLKATVSDILEDLPKTADGEIVAGTSEIGVRLLLDILELPAYLPAKQMQTYRTIFGDAAYNPDLLVGIGNRNYTLLKIATNNAFDEAITNGVKLIPHIDKGGNLLLKPKKLTAKESKNVNAGILKLKEATKLYKEGMDRFDTSVVKQVMKEGGIESSQVLNKILVRNVPEKLNNFLKASDNPEGARMMLQAGLLDDMFIKATDPITGQVSASKVATQIKGLGTTFNNLFGDKSSGLKSAISDVAKIQGILTRAESENINKLLLQLSKTGDIKYFNKELANVKKAAENNLNALQQNFQKELTRRSPEEIIPYLTTKASSQDVIDFIKYFNNQGSQGAKVVQDFKQKYMINFLDNVYDTTAANPVGVVLNGKNILKALKKPGEISRLNAIYGPETTKALQRFAEKAAFLTTRDKTGMTSGIVAANVALNPLQNLGALIRLNVLGKILSNPTTLKYLTTVVENKNKRDVGFALTRLNAIISTELLAAEKQPAVDMETKTEYNKMIIKNALGIVE